MLTVTIQTVRINSLEKVFRNRDLGPKPWENALLLQE